ncbi:MULTISPECIES: agmatinase [unclassified Roseovarius]|uniref:agmatinase n=1 Tax=unclassified Roseovarius TaxID=2614913 RepID=UPI00273DE953|nr:MULTISPECIES: agmatinase [unclassified Roseovarius]
MSKNSTDGFKGPITANSFSGSTTFFRRHAGMNFGDADVVVYGLPYDLGVSNRPGCRFGPRAIREASLQLAWGDVWPWGFDPFDRLAVLDAGDIEYTYAVREEFATAAHDRARDVAAAGAIPFSLGGDHGVTYHSINGVSEVNGPVALVHFDAHTDTSKGPEVQHGTMFRIADEEGTIVADKSIQIGIRTSYLTDDAYLRVHAPDVMNVPAAETAQKILDRVGDMPCYLSFDIDCLDPAYAPGTGTPIPGGISTLQVLEIFRAMGKLCTKQQLNIVGIDIVEVAPCYDHAQTTSLAAVQVAHELLCLLSCAGSGR